ncbi:MULTISPECIES: amidohydrolase family protein [Marisediminitalea]|jgi:imidazolonepropionase-like amidohydrolase|uniref:metal-dependent hydrolase family protein n=1 Tax=Marisediminitalea TaxID=2662254 RepID=UPI0020CC903E|nr:amidohydrolase family protein [Marisediminitalea aggregata]MCP3864840.1 amidohydrolase family protein [Aestuariibacter sp.]MCP4233458.1 amidohydrolase family protein [Aestuariibacter sp.]MCP4528281.1 amidohydrolase family protein [Aestuariibacter sp.]MCP4947419.1 amidohydrolase family protein [Aestuariibacter sp.]MCP5013137.1 amidohydrolase family protein [Aestuariibacter sp.]
MKTWFKSLTLATALLPVGLLQAATVIHAGQAFTSTSDKLTGPISIVVDGNTITRVEKGHIAVGEGDTLVDLSDSVVLPGLMDMHVHLSFQQGGTASYLKRFTQNEADYALMASHYAEKTLMAGFTTVRNLGDSYNETVALRNAISKGIAKGPRIYTAAKSIATTGGHADPSNGMAKLISPHVGPEQGVINGVDEARQAVRQRYKDGADTIKITATGGVLSVAKSGQNPQFMDDELVAVVETAKDYGMKVAVHAHGKEGMIRAIKAGVTSIEHGTYMDKEVMKLMKKHGTYYVPTILAGNFVAEKAKIDGYFPDIVRPKAAAIGPLIQATFGKAYKAGVNIAFGTDSGVSAHGDNAQEFALMVEAGMPPAEAILSATVNTAKLLDVEDTLGTLEAGKLADIIAVKGNPLTDISVLEHVQFVMKDGKIYKQ